MWSVSASRLDPAAAASLPRSPRSVRPCSPAGRATTLTQPTAALSAVAPFLLSGAFPSSPAHPPNSAVGIMEERQAFCWYFQVKKQPQRVVWHSTGHRAEAHPGQGVPEASLAAPLPESWGRLGG